jgi:thiol-disulfide isomerase/thioredoxin
MVQHPFSKRWIFLLFVSSLLITCALCYDFLQKEYKDNQLVHVSDANVTIVVFSDFQSPYDSSTQPTLKQIKDAYGDDVNIIYKQFPMDIHSNARKVAEAVECARDQEKFSEYVEQIFSNQLDLNTTDLKQYAKIINLDTNKFNSCLDNLEKLSVVQRDIQEGKGKNVTITPTFFINGYKIEGSSSFSSFKTIIDAKLDGKPIQEIKKPLSNISVNIESVKTFEQKIGITICKQEDKPIIRLFSTTWCPHSQWIGKTFDYVVREYIKNNQIIAYHWELDTGDNILTKNIEGKVPDSELDIYRTINPTGTVPTLIFGCKYYRVGNGYELQNNSNLEETEFKVLINHLLNESIEKID